MDATVLTQLLTEHQGYVALAAISFAAFCRGYIRGRRFVRKDRPHWVPHLPPLPVQPINLISLLLDVAAWAIVAYMTFSILISVSSRGVARFAAENVALLLFLFWSVLFGLDGYLWATGQHNRPSINTAMRPNPVYRAEDRHLTKRMQDTSKWLGISVLDHLVFDDPAVYSVLHGPVQS